MGRAAAPINRPSPSRVFNEPRPGSRLVAILIRFTHELLCPPSKAMGGTKMAELDRTN